MTFLAPLFLTALAAIAIPVIIHLLNLKKPKRVSFSTLAFFKELQKSTIRRLKIKRLLLLAIRVAAVILLALALSRPYLPPSVGLFTSTGPVLYGVLLDNGMYMDVIDENGPLLEQARDIGIELTDRARDQDRFIIMNTHGDVVRTGILTPAQARETLLATEATPGGTQLPERFGQLSATMQEWQGDARTVFWLTTTFQAGKMGIETLSPADGVDLPVYVAALGSVNMANTVVSDLRSVGGVVGAGRPFTLEVMVSNTGTVPVVRHFVSLEIGGQLAGQYQAELAPGETRPYLFEIPARSPGDLTGRILLEGDLFPADNSYYFSINIPETREILLVTSDNPQDSYLRQVLEAGRQLQERIRLTTRTPAAFLQMSDFDGYDAIILDGLPDLPDAVTEPLLRHVQAGNGLVFYPSELGNLNSYNRFLVRTGAGQITGFTGSFGSLTPVSRLGRIVEGHPVLDTVFDKSESEDVRTTLPSLYYHLNYRPEAASAGFTILRTETGDPILVEQRFGNGTIMLSMLGNGAGWSALPGHPLFAPIAYRTALFAASTSSGGLFQHNVGMPLNRVLALQGPTVDIIKDAQTYRIEAPVTGSGEVRLRMSTESWRPGIYQITDGQTTRMLAANTHVSESDFQSLSSQELENLLKDRVNLMEIFESTPSSGATVREQITAAGFGSEVWHWFILFAILVLLAESAVARWYKAETIS
jgi:hypothetical protein